MKNQNNFKHQVTIPINNSDHDHMFGNRPWFKWAFDNIGQCSSFTENPDDSVWTSEFVYDPEFAVVFYFKYQNDATLFKLRWL